MLNRAHCIFIRQNPREWTHRKVISDERRKQREAEKKLMIGICRSEKEERSEVVLTLTLRQWNEKSFSHRLRNEIILSFLLIFFSFPAHSAACLCAFLTLLSTHSLTVYALSVEPREAYFNGSAYLRLKTPMLLWGHSAISFRTCRGEFLC